jgi:hypothetical protein
MKKDTNKYGCLPLIILLIVVIIIGQTLFGCSKEPLSTCANVSQVYRYSRKLVIDFGVVCGEDLTRFRSYPRYSELAPGCDTTQLEIIIKK